MCDVPGRGFPPCLLPPPPALASSPCRRPASPQAVLALLLATAALAAAQTANVTGKQPGTVPVAFEGRCGAPKRTCWLARIARRRDCCTPLHLKAPPCPRPSHSFSNLPRSALLITYYSGVSQALLERGVVVPKQTLLSGLSGGAFTSTLL